MSQGDLKAVEVTTRVVHRRRRVSADLLRGLTEPSPAAMAAVQAALNSHMSKFARDLARSLARSSVLAASVEAAASGPEPEALPVEGRRRPLIGYRCWVVVDGWVPRPRGILADAQTEPDAWPPPDVPLAARWALASPIRGTIWPGPILRADGEPSAWDPHAPHALCLCQPETVHGIYARFEPDWDDLLDTVRVLERWGGPTDTGVVAMGTALGEVELAGTVIEHERGWRAEWCRIRRLLLSPNFVDLPSAVRALAGRYECEVGCDAGMFARENLPPVEEPRGDRRERQRRAKEERR